MIDLTKIRALCEAATPGPWELEPVHGDLVTPNGTYQAKSYQGIGDYRPDDLALIAESRTLIPELCDEIYNLRVENRALQQRIRRQAAQDEAVFNG